MMIGDRPFPSLLLIALLLVSVSFILVESLGFKSLRQDSNSISDECKNQDEGSLETNDLEACMRHCGIEKCNGSSALLENGNCHCVNDSCIPNGGDGSMHSNHLIGDAIIMTSKFCQTLNKAFR